MSHDSQFLNVSAFMPTWTATEITQCLNIQRLVASNSFSNSTDEVTFHKLKLNVIRLKYVQLEVQPSRVTAYDS